MFEKYFKVKISTFSTSASEKLIFVLKLKTRL